MPLILVLRVQRQMEQMDLWIQGHSGLQSDSRTASYTEKAYILCLEISI